MAPPRKNDRRTKEIIGVAFKGRVLGRSEVGASRPGSGAQFAQEIVEIIGGDLVVLRQDALERAAAMPLAVVLAAVEIGLLRHLHADVEELEELGRQAAAGVDRLEPGR